ncbi:MAG: glutathione S-transferase family protein [Alphaproteobacteria bacterium]|jgi:glutathione S-transferase|nr:glutathione S-transferase family protein [Alphaproteobacteria bacterium]
MTTNTGTRYKLYGWKLSGSLAIEAAFAEAGVAFDFVPIDSKARENLSEAYHRINPRQQLPAVMLPDGTCIAEGPAILLHIADAFPDAALAPRPGSFARAHHDRWLSFFQANVYEGELRKLFPDRYAATADCASSVREAAVSYVERHYEIFEEVLGEGPYFLGERFSVLDIYVWMLAQWMPADWLAARCPKVKRLSDTVASRPAVAPVHDFHFGGGASM